MPMVNVKPVKLGKNVRMSFSRIGEVLEMPNLIEVQKNSYRWFLEEGLKEVFHDVSPITDYQGNLVLDFIDYHLDDQPKYSIAECKERDTTYAAPLRVRASLLNRETGEVKEQDIYMGDFPLMTDSGTFVINGAERVIVSQLVRSPGVYYSSSRDKTGKELFAATVIPNRGAWLEYETDSNDVFYVRIDKNRKLPITTFIRALGIGTDEEICSATTPPFVPPSKRIPPRALRTACWKFTASCAPASRRRWRAPRPIWTTCSSTPDGTICPGSAATSIIRSWPSACAWPARLWPSR